MVFWIGCKGGLECEMEPSKWGDGLAKTKDRSEAKMLGGFLGVLLALDPRMGANKKC